jgi:t-SNARE complex subunit (syntaxin)
MFQDMHTLIQMQGDLLDNIEFNVEKSVAYVETGTENLKTARKLSTKTRNATCCLLVVSAIAGVAVVLIILATLGILGGVVLPKFL